MICDFISVLIAVFPELIKQVDDIDSPSSSRFSTNCIARSKFPLAIVKQCFSYLSIYNNYNNYTDSQKKVEVIARERIQNFMLALGNLIKTPQKNQNSVV